MRSLSLEASKAEEFAEQQRYEEDQERELGDRTEP
jgi:hypothetical protein